MARPAKRYHHLKKLASAGITLELAVKLLTNARETYLSREPSLGSSSRFSCTAVWIAGNKLDYGHANCLEACYATYHAGISPKTQIVICTTTALLVSNWSTVGMHKRNYEVRKQMITDYINFLQGTK